MTLAIVMAVGAVCVMVMLLYLARGGQVPMRSIEELVSRTQPVDLDAFRNLVSTREEEFLRANLSAEQFRRVQRERMKAALDYARRTSHNAAVLLQVARLARGARTAGAAKAAEQLLNSALQMRMFSMLAVCVLHVRILVPGLHIRPFTIVDRYEGLRDSMSGLLRIQVPAAASRVDSAL
jgi:hypothetical protein